jgi:hypothetical protein
MRRPKQECLQAPWDVVLMGHKGCDSDPIYGGDAGTRVDARLNPGYAAAMFPMRDWTHADVFAYCEHNDVPIDTDRYEKVDGVWREKADRSLNHDYVHACTACMDRRAGAAKFVSCPKLGLTVENISSRLQWASDKKPSYMED